MHDIHIIAGPTASGKSALAVSRAQALGGVIINADSLQIYDALPILTAQPGEEDRALVPHLLYGVLRPAEICSAQRWRGMALAAIEDTLNRGMIPILTGGTGLYLNALLYGFSPVPDIPDDIRLQGRDLHREIGGAAFHARLAALDPVMAARLLPSDTQRTIRAWEVLTYTGRSLAYWQSLPPQPPPPSFQFHITIVDPPRDVLYDRCNTRFDRMLAAGALQEVDAYRRLWPPGLPPERALGFHALAAMMRNDVTPALAAADAKAQTRHYAKRQATWFRNQIEPAPWIATIERLHALS